MDWDNECDVDPSIYEPIDDECDTTDFDEDDLTSMGEAGCSSLNVSKAAEIKGRQTYMTSRLAAALDNAKVSDGMATHILIAAAEALGHRIEELVISRSSVQRSRKENRFVQSRDISTSFVDNVIHSDLEFNLFLV